LAKKIRGTEHLGHESFYQRCASGWVEERGQAHLPDHELIKVESETFIEKLSGGDFTERVAQLSGPEGGLAPALDWQSFLAAYRLEKQNELPILRNS
jgi:hypothetical protein